MRSTCLLAALALTAPLAQPLKAAAAVESAELQATLFADAAAAFRARHYAAAYGRFARLADGGHPASALLALAMLTQGRTLFGSDWSASLEQRRRWSALTVDSLLRQAGAEGQDAGAE